MGSKHSTPRAAPVIERIESLVDRIPIAGCWIFTGTCLPSGYGQVRVGQKAHYTHRLMYEHYVGPIPRGHYVCHRCDVPSCVNPSHLFSGTHADNVADMDRKGRRKNCPPRFGEDNPNLKYAVEDVRAVILDRMSGMRLKAIAEKHGLSRRLVARFLYDGVSWIWLRNEMGFVPTKGRRGKWCSP